MAQGAVAIPYPVGSRAEREQPLVDRGGHLTDKFDHAPPVLENPRFPGELIARSSILA